MILKKQIKITPKVNRLLRKESPITASRVSEKVGVNLSTARDILSEIERKGRITRSSNFDGDTWWVRVK